MPLSPVEITMDDIKAAKSFMAGQHIPAATNKTGPRPITNKESLGPNMTSFVQSPEGNAMLQRLLANSHVKPIKGQLVNPIGLA